MEQAMGLDLRHHGQDLLRAEWFIAAAPPWHKGLAAQAAVRRGRCRLLVAL
jgi:hypothetical protein